MTAAIFLENISKASVKGCRALTICLSVLFTHLSSLVDQQVLVLNQSINFQQ